ncbi:hypothetical protein ARMSODRAFT_1024886 [Armillaria solidipes]|uniref:Uncharacterized protein n=1 Tax=Armillaria solidipes TaxID=1076256 RepID=A0A2H3BF67_9AGAR|nr:hypothetical protein ARMSODRAFT_1024886 [Armillaria solidipes]
MSYEKTMFLARAWAMGTHLFQRHTLPAHPENDPPPTIHAPLPQLPPTASPDREWSSRLEEIPHTHDTMRLVSSLLGTDPRAQMELPRAPTPALPHSEDPCLSPITLGSTPSPTPKSPALPPPTTCMSPVLSPAPSP